MSFIQVQVVLGTGVVHHFLEIQQEDDDDVDQIMVEQEPFDVEIDFETYERETGSVVAQVVAKDRGVRGTVLCYDCAPWDVFDSIWKLREVIDVKTCRKTESLKCKLIGTRTMYQNIIGDDVDIVEEKLFRVGLDLELEIRPGILGDPKKNLTPNLRVPFASLCYRFDPRLVKVLPHESFHTRKKMLTKNERDKRSVPYCSRSCFKDVAWLMELSHPSSKKKDQEEEEEEETDEYRLVTMYSKCHLISTGRDLDDKTGTLSSLEVISSGKMKDSVVIKPLENASERAADRLVKQESRIQELFSTEPGNLFALPIPLLFMVARYLCARDVRNFRNSCRYIHFVCSIIVPGLNVSLFAHQKQAIRWMDGRESTSLAESSNASSAEQEFFHEFCQHPNIVTIPRGFANQGNDHHFCDLLTGQFHRAQNIPQVNPVRGGMLCDEPGLGKTITMLSLILRSQGSSATKEKVQPVDEKLHELNLLMETIWANLPHETHKIIVTEVLQALLVACRKSALIKTSSIYLQGAVGCTISVLRKNAGTKFDLFSKWRSFCTDTVNAIVAINKDVLVNGEDLKTQQGIATQIRLEMNEALNTEIVNIQSRYRSKAVRNTLPRKKLLAQEETKEHLIPSGATLVVVPKTLLSHWENQVQQHINPAYLPENPFYFDHDTSRPLPTAEELAKYTAVFTTTPRLSKEEARRKHNSPLRVVKWLRVIVDEGHSLGASSLSLYVNFLLNIPCEYRWVMSGTPAKETNLADGLRSLNGLATFLRHDPFGQPGGTLHWNNLVARPLDKRSPFGAIQLVGFLYRTMIRHTKVDCAELPPLIMKNVPLTMTNSERTSYNALVTYARTNIVLCEIGKKTLDISLLHPNNQKPARELINNIRISCSGGGRMCAVIKDVDWIETRQLLQTKYGATVNDIRKVNEFIIRVQRGETTACENPECGWEMNMLLLTPCVHFICLPCFEKHCVPTNDFHCLCCKEPFNPNSFAALQPGFQLVWVGSTDLRKRDQTNAQLGTVNFTGSVKDIGISSKALYIMNRIKQLRAEHNARMISSAKSSSVPFKCIVYSQFRSVLNVIGHHCIVEFGADAVAEFWGKSRDLELNKYIHNQAKSWSCSACAFVNDLGFRNCERVFLELVDPSNTQDHIRVPSDSLPGWHMGTQYHVGQQVISGGKHGIPRKVVKLEKCQGKLKTSIIFDRPDVDCHILLLSQDGSTGLDLSMTTHIFLVDKIWDFAVQDQIVSRAWRLGAKASEINVEQIYIQDTIEQLMFDDPSEKDNNSEVTQANGRKDFGKIRYLLSHMKPLLPLNPNKTKIEPVSSSSSAILPAKKKRKFRVCFADQVQQPLVFTREYQPDQPVESK